MAALPDPLAVRQADHEVDPLFVKRWSPRAMSGEAVEQSLLNRLLEAARWAPSTYNEQEWRFLYAHRETPHFQTFFELLLEGNQAWCDRAGVLMVVISRKKFVRNNQPNKVHSFDAGMATQNLALQGTVMNLVVHPMAGFVDETVYEALNIPEDFHVNAMVAIGHPGSPADLSEDFRKAEVPTGRKPIGEISCEGPFAF